jgi:uncharacterized protein
LLCNLVSAGKIVLKRGGKPPLFNNMEPSCYLKAYPYKEKPGYQLLYSTKKASISLLKEQTYNELLRGGLSADNEQVLSGLGMIVPDRKQEKKEMAGFLDRINEMNTILNISVILNLDCNFDCIYCYEDGMKGKFYMSEETAGLLLEFIKGRFTPGKKSINIDFYGGEPLLSAGLIKSISAKTKSFAKSRGAEYTFTLVTNGSLFKRRVAEDLAALGLGGVKITLDGPAEVHDSCRPFKSGVGSYDSIIRNIKETCDITKIRIGGNYQRDNYKVFPRLIDYLEDEGLTPDAIYQLKFDPVMNSPDDGAGLADYAYGFMSVNEPWVIKASALLREEILKKGYDTPRLAPSPCQVEKTDSYVVNFDGAIYKCPALIGRKDFEIGSLREGVKDYADSHRLGSWRNDECAECEYLPLCFGGCRYLSFIRDGNIDSVDCKRPYFDAILETLIVQDIACEHKVSCR